MHTMLYRNIEHFPLAFVLNTGTHKNGGTHWQSMYIDHEHTVYFSIPTVVNQVTYFTDLHTIS